MFKMYLLGSVSVISSEMGRLDTNYLQIFSSMISPPTTILQQLFYNIS